jgi:hypothetical protein
MNSTFFLLPNLPDPWNKIPYWELSETIEQHGIKKKEITSECFYYLEVLTDLLYKYGSHYSFDKLPQALKQLSPDPADREVQIYKALSDFSGRVHFICPTFQAFNIEKVRELLLSEFLTDPPKEEEVEVSASRSLTLSLIRHIDWVLLKISNWIGEQDDIPQWIIDNMELYVERNWRKIPEPYFIETVDMMFGLVYRMNKIPGYVYGSYPTTKQLPKVLNDMVHTLQTEPILNEHQQWFAAQLDYRIGGPKPPPDEDEEEDD